MAPLKKVPMNLNATLSGLVRQHLRARNIQKTPAIWPAKHLNCPLSCFTDTPVLITKFRQQPKLMSYQTHIHPESALYFNIYIMPSNKFILLKVLVYNKPIVHLTDYLVNHYSWLTLIAHCCLHIYSSATIWLAFFMNSQALRRALPVMVLRSCVSDHGVQFHLFFQCAPCAISPSRVPACMACDSAMVCHESPLASPFMFRFKPIYSFWPSSVT